jgi:hypothetical protein
VRSRSGPSDRRRAREAPPSQEPEAPEVAAQVEQKPQEAGVTAQPAPEMIADEMGVAREQELV